MSNQDVQGEDFKDEVGLVPEPRIERPINDSQALMEAGIIKIDVPNKPTKKFKPYIRSRLGLERHGKENTDINTLPVLEIDDEGFAMRPPTVSPWTRGQWNPEQKKFRFLLMYNYSGGNVSLACQDAGVTREYYENNWLPDPLFKKKLNEQEQEIGDRILNRVMEALRIVPVLKRYKMNESAIFALGKKYKPDLFDSDELPPTETIPNVPRPAR